MKVCVLASGSGGNSTYIETNNYKILVDIGKNRKYIVEKLESIGVNPEDINYIFISHLHDDHISALKIFRRCKSKKVILDHLQVRCIHSSHDATDSRNFVFESDGASVVYVTDTGYVNHKNFKYLQNKDVYLFESNHDIERLQHGPYPDWLKMRVLSDYGHLSNNACSLYLTKLIGDKTKKIYLMHLSEKNNTEELALREINHIFDTYNISFRNITCAKPDEASEVIQI